MKNKILSFVLLVGLFVMQTADARHKFLGEEQPTAIVRTADSIIINFGKKGSRIAIYVADAKDKEKLKDLDLNALLAKIQDKLATIDDKNTETTITEGDMTLKVYKQSNAEGTENQKVIVTDTTKRRNINIKWGWDKEKNSGKKNKRMVRSYLDFDLGLNTLLGNPNTQLTELSPIGSRYVAIGFGVRIRLSESKPLRLNTGLEFAWNNLMFENNNVRIDRNDTQVLFSPSFAPQSKSKLVVANLNVPLTFSYRFPNTPFGVALGGYVGYRIDSYNAYVESGKDKEQYHNSFFLNAVRYGVRGAVDFKYATLFCNYDLSPLFQSNKGIADMQVVSFGVKILAGSL